MLFPTVAFAIFFVVVLTLGWALSRWAVPWKLFLIGASFFFYGYWDERFVLLLAGSIIGNYAFGRAVHASLGGESRTATNLLVACGVGANLILLGWFKYYGFFVTEVADGLDSIGLGASPPLLKVVLPVGISFFTFQGISYIVDLRRGVVRPLPLIDFALYQAFFPHLVAGPIVRASEFGPQVIRPPDWRSIETNAAFVLILSGLFKKVVLSSYLASEIVDPVFAAPNAHTGAEAWLAMYGYAIQIYADFSGYTDIAIGCALLLGIRFPQNFDAPYRATSLQDFWRRWHMTLSRWLRDYLYIPLGGSRGSNLFTMRNIMITMVLGGLWHGAAWTFAAWGAIHGAAQAFERQAREMGLIRWLPRSVSAVVGWALTFQVVCFAWVFFRAESFDFAGEMFDRMFTGGWGGDLIQPMVIVAIVAPLLWQVWPRAWDPQVRLVFARLAPPAQIAVLAAGLVAIDALGPEGVAPFIYFQF